MTVKQQIADYCKARLTPEEIEDLKVYTGDDSREYESFEDWKAQFDLATVEDFIKEDVINATTFDDLEGILEHRLGIIRSIKKLFHSTSSNGL